MKINRNKSRGMSLIIPMITFGIIASLALFAVPNFRDHSIRIKVDEALFASNSGKTVVSQACRENPEANIAKYDANMFIDTNYVAELIIGGSCEQAYLELTTRNTGARVAPVVDIVGVFEQSTGQFQWSCTRFRGEFKHLPETCQEDSPFR